MLKKFRILALALGMFMAVGVYAEDVPTSYEGKTKAEAKAAYDVTNKKIKGELDVLEAQLNELLKPGSAATLDQITAKRQECKAKESVMGDEEKKYKDWADNKGFDTKLINREHKVIVKTITDQYKQAMIVKKEADKLEEIGLKKIKDDTAAAVKAEYENLVKNQAAQKELMKQTQAKELADLDVKLNGGTLSDGVTVVVKGGEGSLDQATYDAQKKAAVEKQAADKKILDDSHTKEKDDQKLAGSGVKKATSENYSVEKKKNTQERKQMTADKKANIGAEKLRWEALKK